MLCHCGPAYPDGLGPVDCTSHTEHLLHCSAPESGPRQIGHGTRDLGTAQTALHCHVLQVLDGLQGPEGENGHSTGDGEELQTDAGWRGGTETRPYQSVAASKQALSELMQMKTLVETWLLSPHSTCLLMV